ncbi:hypothetical protein [Bathymodiolus japonicus methanotrophic gill symbiont]|uniref:hypothetical protein n=1 Tax=Bathymodiolus japonicus methanotrophic gill symbiont TaxID=113269 RepID=UPI001C8D1323|nr:hypothetical protein [Bathymodiolus japonicus methanotrophic gill symbiont]
MQKHRFNPLPSFKGTHFPKDVILYAVFFYVRYGVSYRDLEEINDAQINQLESLTHTLRIETHDSR